MLSNIKSPSFYMQAAFRAQNPFLFYDNVAKEHLRKENVYEKLTLDVKVCFFMLPKNHRKYIICLIQLANV